MLFYLFFLLQLFLMIESATLNLNRQESDPCQSTPDSLNHPWPNGIIPYIISSVVPNSLRTPLHFALQKVEVMSCVQFLPRTTQADYVLIRYGERCCSHSGLVGSGRQLLYVSEICINGNETLSETISKLANVVAHNYCQSSCGSSHVIIPGSSPGQVTSPGFPLYPPHSNCVWRLWIPENRTLNLNFVKINLEIGHGCLYDYINIFQEDNTGRIINTTRLCGNHAYHQLNTSNETNVVSVHFSSDESTQKEGFILKYSLLNDEVMCAVNNGGCAQICNSDEQGVKTSCSCKLGYQLLSDNTSCEDINECPAGCQQKCMNTIGSYYCHCRQGYGLTNDTETCQVCGGTLNLTSGIITPPRHLHGYSPYQNCKWTLNIWPGHYLNVTIQDIDIVNSSECSLDYLRPTHGKFRHRKHLCGQHRLIQYILHGSISKTHFRFYSGPPTLETRNGFTIFFQQVPISQVSRTQLKTVNVNGTDIAYNTKYWV